LAPDEGPGFG
jgi:site-specific recombinase XerD